MQRRLLLIATATTVLLSGCMSFNQTGVLVTPFGVAGIHSFAPEKTPDTMDAVQIQSMEHRVAAAVKD